MFPEFFKNKMREVGNFLRIMKVKSTKNDQKKARGVGRDTNTRNRPTSKILRTEVDRDISAI